MNFCCTQNTYLSAVYQNIFLAFDWQTENESYRKKLEKESKLVSDLRHQMTVAADEKEQEIHDLHQQLTDLQVLCC